MEEKLSERLAMANQHMERLRKAKVRLTEEVSELMGRNADEQLRWTASKVDLMEALYYAYEQGTIRDDEGVPVPFRTMVAQCCQVLHVGAPSNPYEMANRGRLRKGVKHRNFMERYLAATENRDGGLHEFWQSDGLDRQLPHPAEAYG